MQETFIVAELSANHNNDFPTAVKTVEEIAKSGANAVKIQTFKPESLTLPLSDGLFGPREKGLWKGYTPWELYSKAAMPYEWQPELKKIAEDLGLVFFSSPFDFEAVDFLEDLDVPLYKIASFEITDIPLIRYIAKTKKPIIISTGVADESDIELAINSCLDEGNNNLTLLKCTSDYPAQIENVNLKMIPDMRNRFGFPIGLSDHTLSNIVPIVAVALGAVLVEKHFILDKRLGGIDSQFSVDPVEFKMLVQEIRDVEKSFGVIDYSVSEDDKSRRRSLFAVNNIKKGEIISEDNIRSIRPGYGLPPKLYFELIGKRASEDIAKGTPLKIEMVE
jgi:pseudaminic acid synthase